jgi:putative transposase
MPNYPNHLHGFNYTGFHRYFLTFCTCERRRHYVTAAAVDLSWKQFLRASHETGVVTLAYCFMPDHIHLLVEGTREDASLKKFSAKAKQYSGFYFRREMGVPLWQRFGFERVLRDEEATEDVARYILNNPLRARLVADVLDYPFWGSQIYGRAGLIEYIQRAG